MLFWLIAALMTLTACLAVLVPLVRRPPAGAPDTDGDTTSKSIATSSTRSIATKAAG